jgi:small subunit ribosomal protein S20
MHNRSVKGAIKTQIKDVLDAKPGDELVKQFRLAAKQLDKAAAKGVIHPNMAARKKSQLAKHVNRQSASSSK